MVTPGVKTTRQQLEAEQLLSEDGRTLFRALAARANDLVATGAIAKKG